MDFLHKNSLCNHLCVCVCVCVCYLALKSQPKEVALQLLFIMWYKLDVVKRD